MLSTPRKWLCSLHSHASQKLLCLTYIGHREFLHTAFPRLQKRKWSKEEIGALKYWRKENKLLFGDIIKPNKELPLTKKKSKTGLQLRLQIPLKSVNSELKHPNKNSLKTDCTERESKTIDLTNVYRKEEKVPPKTSKVDFVPPLEFPISTCPLDNLLSFPMLGSSRANDSIVLPGQDNGRLPSVSMVLKNTMSEESKFFLERWEQEMIEKLGQEGFNQYKKEMFETGHQLHSCIEQHIQGREASELNITENIEGHWNSLQQVFPNVKEVLFTEEKVVHQQLQYTGIFDCIAHYRGQLCVIDWKTSKKKKPRLAYTYDNPLQLAAYLGAINSDPQYTEKVQHAVLVISYEDGSPAHVFQLTPYQCTHYWRLWLRRLHKYWSAVINNQDTSVVSS